MTRDEAIVAAGNMDTVYEANSNGTINTGIVKLTNNCRTLEYHHRDGYWSGWLPTKLRHTEAEAWIDAALWLDDQIQSLKRKKDRCLQNADSTRGVSA